MFPAGLIASSGWAAGLNLWAVAVVLGVAGRAGWADTPAFLQRTPVLAVTLVLFAVEFVVDKIPYVDSVWDAANTLVRPLGGAWLAVVLTPGTPAGHRALAVAGAAVGALTSHSAKASLRALINLSPEPFTNVAASLTEDGVVVGIVSLALAHPRIALVVAVVAAIACVAVVWWVARVLRRAGRRLRAGLRRPARRAATS